MSVLPILTTSLIHFSLKGWEIILFELGSERVKRGNMYLSELVRIKYYNIFRSTTFSQPFKEKYISEVVRIGSIIIFHLMRSYEKPSSSYCVMSYRVNLKFITLGGEFKRFCNDMTVKLSVKEPVTIIALTRDSKANC